jgi:hypothetical protein
MLRRQIAHAGDCTQEPEKKIKGTFPNNGAKVDFGKFEVEKREGRPYGTRSYLPGGAALENRTARRQVVPPCSSCGSARSVL